jgi:hypothetical protein
MKYNSRSEAEVIKKVAADTGLPQEEVYIAYQCTTVAIKEELKEPKYFEIVWDKLGTFKYTHNRVERMLNKLLKRIDRGLDKNLDAVFELAIDLNYHFKKLFKARKLYTKNYKHDYIDRADEILSNYSNTPQ